ncbi:uncharacterized protein LOC135337365 [Halichondria panicea]|uniref:uncharacterized protein LOC135337365 n=1 Tax=Halichondria panicea TaxID=6063 RepID=UPI00312BABD4
MECVLVLVLFLCLCVHCSALNVSTVNVTGYKQAGSYLNSSVYVVDLPSDSGYVHPPMLVHLTGSRHDMGYAYGYLLSSEIKESYQYMLSWILRKLTFLQPELEAILDYHWNHHLSKSVPPVYQAELAGLAEGASKNGCSLCAQYITRAYVLANLPSDGKDIVKLLSGQYNSSTLGGPHVLPLLARRLSGFMCSMLGVWGSRTQGGKLFSSRNLDWKKDTGINKHKMVLVTVPDDGGLPSASLGFVLIYGPLAGLSESGLTVTEANLEENWESLDGFPWVLRLRFIMEYATDMTSARKLWESTNNTVGFNHMISSGKDATDYINNGGHSIVALVMETMYGYTAYFHDNDPRESDALYTPQDGALPVHIGYPLHEALWRTNHGYDPVIRAHFQWSQSPSTWSNTRYMDIYNALQYYANKKMGPLEVINITAIAGDKGHSHAYQCQDNNNGTNILSSVFQPQDKTMYVAWERSSGVNWRPAACSKYINFNLTNWFNPKPPMNLVTN